MKKKWILGILIVVAVAFTGYYAVNVYGHYVNPTQTDNYGYFGYGMMGGGYCYDGDESQTPSYEFLYSHLSADNQVIINQMYTDQLANYNFTNMTTAEREQTINQIKSDLVQYMIDNNMLPDGFNYNNK